MSLKAGFGSSTVQLTDEMLPTFGEHYNSIHDLPSVKVMLLEAGESFALVSVGLVMGDKRDFLAAAQSELQIPADHIIIHLQHILATPHYEAADTPEAWAAHHREPVTPEDAEVFWKRDQAIHGAYLTAVREASRQARERLCPAKLGVAAAHADVTVNRVVHTKQGWWQGVNQDGETDRSVYCLRVGDESGNTLGLVFNVNVAPGCLEFSETGGGRAISADLAGASERFVEEQLDGGAVAMYTTGATGDQWQALRARLDYLTPDGEQKVRDLHETGFDLVEILGTRLGEQVVKTTLTIKTEELESLQFSQASFFYPHQNVLDADFRAPALHCRYELDGKDEAGVALLRMGDAVVVFCGSEMNVSALRQLRENAHYSKLWLVEFSTVGGGYMPPADFYDRVTFQSLKSHYGKGTAEHWVTDVAQLLSERR